MTDETPPKVKSVDVTVQVEYEDGRTETMVWDMDPKTFHFAERRSMINTLGGLVGAPEVHLVLHGTSPVEETVLPAITEKE